MIVLDTNVVSELMKADPSSAVVEWIRAQRSTQLFTTSVSVAEIGYGIERLPAGKRRSALTAAAVEIFKAFESSVLSFDYPAASTYGSLVDSRERSGKPISGFGAQIASICMANNASLATRNTRGFAELGIAIVDPWS